MSTNAKFLELLDVGLNQASIPNGSSLIVAFSGGPDSSALLAGLVNLADHRKLSIVAAHVNHQIRQGSSKNDQDGAQRIAKALGVEFISVTIDVPAIASTKKISIELAARISRYAALADISSARNALGIATGHNRDDQSETVLLHASRGAGLKGISGMSYNSILKIPDSEVDVRVLRPMLDTPRNECVKFCEEVGIDPIIDDSNGSRDYTRNKIRLDVLPLLNEAIPEASQALARLAKNANSDLEIIDWVVERHLTVARVEPHSYSRVTVSGLPTSLITRMLLKAYESHTGHIQNLERPHISDMVSLLLGHSGTLIKLPNGVDFYVDKDVFGFRSIGEDDCPYPNPISPLAMKFPGATELETGVIVSAEIIDRPKRLETDNSHITYATPDLLSHKLELRNRSNGDRFQPLGMKPQVKLQDFFVGAGVPERWRDRILIVDSEIRIIWIAGYRLAEWAKVLPEHEQVTKFELVGAKGNLGNRSD